MKQLKFLIVGLGSIGERHVRNLLHLGLKDISVFRRSTRKPRTLDGSEFKTFNDWQSALGESPDVVIITNPTALHVPPAVDAAKNRAHLFIEKPLSNPHHVHGPTAVRSQPSCPPAERGRLRK